MSHDSKRRKLSSNDLPSLHRSVSPPAPSPPKQSPAAAVSSNNSDPLRSYFREGSKGQAPDRDHPLTLTISDSEDGEDGDVINGEGFSAGLPTRGRKKKSGSSSLTTTTTTTTTTTHTRTMAKKFQTWESPFKLTHITHLPDSENVGTVKLEDILGDVMLDEVWIFNYMHNIPWVMDKFDPDIVSHIKVTFMHGNWKEDDQGRLKMEEDAKSWPNVTVKAAYMPEMFGTHHTKMMILFRRDGMAQVVVHTANMIPFDWANMTQAAWISPLLPLITPASLSTLSDTAPKPRRKSNNASRPTFGDNLKRDLLSYLSSFPPSPTIGGNFKRDLLSYLSFYGRNRTGPLVDRISQYSFSSVRAIFVSSVPGRHKLTESKFGWPKLRKELSKIPTTSPSRSKIMCQMSSIATLGANDTWLTPVFFNALSQTSTPNPETPEFGIIFPTATEIRASLNGYASGSSIHLRLTSAAQQKALSTYLQPLLHHWSTNTSPFPGASPKRKSSFRSPSPPPGTGGRPQSAGRNLAAPHIKTYIRFSDSATRPGETEIEWALLTSANLSMQAWGAAAKGGEVRVCSYEAGVLVHPGLWDDATEEERGADEKKEEGKRRVKMMPVFKKNEWTNGSEKKVIVIDDDGAVEEVNDGKGGKDGEGEDVVALRMPYGLPVRKYAEGEEVWAAGKSYVERDRLGMSWANGTYGD